MSKLTVFSFCCALLSVPVCLMISESAFAYLLVFGTSIVAAVASKFLIARGKKRRGEKWAGRAIYLAIGWFVLMWVSVSLVSRTLYDGTRGSVSGHLKQLAEAMHQYADEHDRHLPPAAIFDNRGRPLLSWRVLLLPYLKQQKLFDRFKLDEPWDSPRNRKLINEMPKVYESLAGAERGTTFCQVFVGPGTAFERRPAGVGWRISEDFPDSLYNTILIAHGSQAVPWTKPADIIYDPKGQLPAIGGQLHPEIRFNPFPMGNYYVNVVALANGSVRHLSPDISEATLRAAITRNDGKPLGPDW